MQIPIVFAELGVTDLPLPLEQATVDGWLLLLKDAGLPPEEIEGAMFDVWLEYSEWGQEFSDQMESELRFSTEPNEAEDMKLLAEISEAGNMLKVHAFNAS